MFRSVYESNAQDITGRLFERFRLFSIILTGPDRASRIIDIGPTPKLD